MTLSIRTVAHPAVCPAVCPVMRPLALAACAVLLQACAAPPPQVAKKELAMEPLLRLGHSSGQTALSYYQLGKYHQERGNDALAIDAYRHSLVLDSQQLEARNALAAVYSQQRKLDEAKSLLLDLVAQYPAVAHPYNNLGYIYFIEGNYSAAVQTLKRALVLDFANERARNNLRLAEQALAKSETGNPVTLQAGASVNTLNMTSPPDAINELTPALITSGPENRDQIAGLISTKNTMTADATGDTGKIKQPDQPAAKMPGLVPQARMELVQLAANVLELRLKPGLDGKPVNVIAASPDQAPAKVVMQVLEKMLIKTAVTLDSKVQVQVQVPGLATRAAKIQVANGNGVVGMARRVSHVLGKSGIAVSSLANERPYVQQETKILYRAGYEQTANLVRQALRGEAVLVQASQMAANADVRLVIGEKAISQLARLEAESGAPLATVNAQTDAEGKDAAASRS